MPSISFCLRLHTSSFMHMQYIDIFLMCFPTLLHFVQPSYIVGKDKGKSIETVTINGYSNKHTAGVEHSTNSKVIRKPKVSINVKSEPQESYAGKFVLLCANLLVLCSVKMWMDIKVPLVFYLQSILKISIQLLLVDMIVLQVWTIFELLTLFN